MPFEGMANLMRVALLLFSVGEGLTVDRIHNECSLAHWTADSVSQMGV
jgi:hypothetical protein